MYYITNAKGYPIAADKAFLEIYGVDSIEALLRKVDDFPRERTETLEAGNTLYHCSYAELDSILGTLYVVTLTEAEETTDFSEDTAFLKEAEETFELTETEELPIEETEVERKSEEDTFDIGLDLESPLLEEEPPAQTVESEPQEELVDLLLPTEGEVRVDELVEETSDTAVSLIEEEESEEALMPLFEEEEEKEEEKTLAVKPDFDFEANAEKIGVTPDDYKTFIDEYLQTAEQLRDKIFDGDAEAISKLTHLGNVLQLSDAVELLEELSVHSSKEKAQAFFDVLERYVSKKENREETSLTPPSSEEKTEAAPQPVAEEGAYIYDTIDLSDVKPIRFDFTVEEAANDLSLPTELIEEFIMDFIKQAHEETERMIEAYRKGDLETVQKIGHLLKGTSSNLRITPLADTLYEIQFNDDIEKVPELVRNYWGYFLSLENQMKLITKSNT
jgi:HPt (histidine-containing phosphotransfer) domain-containing protein